MRKGGLAKVGSAGWTADASWPASYPTFARPPHLIRLISVLCVIVLLSCHSIQLLCNVLVSLDLSKRSKLLQNNWLTDKNYNNQKRHSYFSHLHSNPITGFTLFCWALQNGWTDQKRKWLQVFKLGSLFRITKS